MADSAKLLINIDGQDHAKNLTIEKSFDTKIVGNGSYENKYSVTVADSPITVGLDPAKSGILNKLIVTSSSLTEQVILKLYINNGVDPAYTVSIPFIEFIVLNLGNTYFGYLTQIDLETSASSTIDLTVRAYV